MVDAVEAQTVYRVLQESVTNVLRHAEATNLILWIVVLDDWITVEILDGGVGLPSGFMIGKGLTGTRERVRALGGDFDIVRLTPRRAFAAGCPLCRSRCGQVETPH